MTDNKTKPEETFTATLNGNDVGFIIQELGFCLEIRQEQHKEDLESGDEYNIEYSRGYVESLNRLISYFKSVTSSTETVND